MPTTSGSISSLSTTRIHRLSQVSTELTRIETISTISKKLVPHRGWNRTYFLAFSGVSRSPAS